MNESFWDAQNVEIEACAIFEHFAGSGKICHPGKKMTDWMLGEAHVADLENAEYWRARCLSSATVAYMLGIPSIYAMIC